MSEPLEIEVLGQFIRILDELEISYAIGGSMASSAYGVVRFTQDADLTVAPFPNQAEAFVKAVEVSFYISKEAMFDAIQLRRSFNVIHLETAFKIDIFICRDNPFDRQVLERRQSLELSAPQGKRFSFVTPEDIVLLKLEWYRDGGEVSERQWSDIVNVLRVQGETLDQEYLKHNAQQLRALDLLEKACADAGA